MTAIPALETLDIDILDTETVTDESLWLDIYFKVLANPVWSASAHPVAWADHGLAEFKKRFRSDDFKKEMH